MRTLQQTIDMPETTKQEVFDKLDAIKFLTGDCILDLKNRLCELYGTFSQDIPITGGYDGRE